ncbi:hypothetical protein LTS18_012881, partial [Coniosporium uncinatum]
EFHWYDVRRGLLDWKIWVFCFGQFGVDTMLYGYSTFLPTIIRGINPSYSAALVQVLTIPCYALGALTYLSVAWVSDSRQQRGLPIVAFCGISIVGYGMLISNGGAGVHYAGCFLVAMGLYVGVGLPLAWLPTNQPRYGKRTTATGLQLTIGNCAGILSSFLYPMAEGPRYVRGHGVTLALVGFAAVLYAGMSVYFVRRNKKRLSGAEDGKVVGKSEEEIAEMGDESPRFVFTF